MDIYRDGQGPIGQVREGMTVIDVEGEEVGTVRAIRMGDPGAETGGQDTQHTGGIIGAVAQAFHAANDLPPGLRDRLIRLGYLQIDAGGLFGGDRYASAEDVAEVRDDVVRLGVGGADLVG